MRLPVRLELLLGFSLLSSGCDGKLAPTDRTAATLAPRSGVIVGAPPVSHRVWGIELAGTLVSHNRRAGDAGSVAWFVEGKADVAVGAQHSSLSATSWVDGTDIHERAFYVDNNGILQIRAIDNGVRTWLPSPLPQGALLRATTDAVVGSASVFAAALTTDGVPNLVVFSADKAPPGLYTVDSQHSGSPSPLDESSPIAGVAVASRYCFFTRTAADTINVAPGGSQWALPDSAARSALAATLYSGVEVLLFVGALDATVRLAVWSGGCDGAPSWVNLGTPGTALAAGRSSLAATSYLHPDHGLVVELLAVSTNGLVYRRIYSPALPGWLPWTPVGPIVSDGTSLPGALSAIAPTQIDASDAYSHAFFVVNESAANITYSVPPTGYLFEAFGGTVSNHTGAKTGFRTITSDTLDYTESFLADRGGKVVIASMVQELNAPNRIAILGSTDDGLHFHQMLLPSQYPGHEEGTMYIQGDPSVAIDSTGTAWVLGHELKLTATGCDDPAQRSVHSKIILASIGADFPAVFEPIDALWDVATPGAPDPDTYLDHPMMTITSDDRQHFVWWDQTAATILYRSRLSTQALGSPGTEPVVLPAALGAPYILSGSGNNVYVHDANFLCTVSGPAGLSCASGLIGMAAAVSGSPSSPIEIPGSPYDLRGPGASLAASPALGAHLYYAYLCTDGAGTTYDSSQFQGPWNVCFAESADGGLSWPAPLLLSNAGSEQGTDQFGPLVLAMGNGDVVVTYYDRSADPLGNSGTMYGERVAYRRGGVWYHGQRNAAALGASDLSLLPRKCFNNTHLFMGDYRISIGGFNHGHDLRVDTLPAVFPQVTTARLRVGTLSPTSWE